MANNNEINIENIKDTITDTVVSFFARSHIIGFRGRTFSSTRGALEVKSIKYKKVRKQEKIRENIKNTNKILENTKKSEVAKRNQNY